MFAQVSNPGPPWAQTGGKFAVVTVVLMFSPGCAFRVTNATAEVSEECPPASCSRQALAEDRDGEENPEPGRDIAYLAEINGTRDPLQPEVKPVHR